MRNLVFKRKETKRKILTGVVMFLSSCGLSAQGLGVKSNLLYDATTTLNAGIEVGLSRKWTVDIPLSYNPWTFADGMKFKHWLLQPELRYWPCLRFSGHFFGLHLLYGEFNAAKLKWLGLGEYRYEGEAYGAGLSYGYQWTLSPRWSLEATLGIGYALLDYKRYGCNHCDALTEAQPSPTHYLGPTKAGLSLIYIIK